MPSSLFRSQSRSPSRCHIRAVRVVVLIGSSLVAALAHSVLSSWWARSGRVGICGARGLGENCDRIVVISDNPFVMLGALPQARVAEFEHVLRLNLASPFVAQVHFLNQAHDNGSALLLPSTRVGGKLHVHDLGWRSTFLDALRYANAVLPAGTLFAVANADIAFAHPSVRIAARLADPDAVLALSRHEAAAVADQTDPRSPAAAAAAATAATLHEDPPWSQDAWVMRTPFPEHLDFDFPLGALGSDNKLAYLFKHVLHRDVYNWCQDIAILHYHASQVRSNAKPRLPMPYATAPPARVNLSAIRLEWMVQSRVDNRPYGLARTDIGALLQRPPAELDAAHLHLPNPAPLHLSAAALRMYAVLRDRGSGHWYYLDLPWSVLTLTRSPLYDADALLEGLSFKLRRRVDRLFSLLPQEAVPVLCAPRARAFVGKVCLGSVSPDGQFEGLVVCPPAL